MTKERKHRRDNVVLAAGAYDRGLRYVLRDKLAVACETPLQWAIEFERADRRVATTRLKFHRISTVFLGLDHALGEGPPLVFETMVFGEGDCKDDSDCDRYSTWEEAEQGHKAMVDKWSKMEDMSAKKAHLLLRQLRGAIDGTKS